MNPFTTRKMEDFRDAILCDSHRIQKGRRKVEIEDKIEQLKELKKTSGAEFTQAIEKLVEDASALQSAIGVLGASEHLTPEGCPALLSLYRHGLFRQRDATNLIFLLPWTTYTRFSTWLYGRPFCILVLKGQLQRNISGGVKFGKASGRLWPPVCDFCFLTTWRIARLCSVICYVFYKIGTRLSGSSNAKCSSRGPRRALSATGFCALIV